jgi:hypothetical protein
MARRYKRQYNEEDNLSGFIIGIVVLYIFYLFLKWFTNRAEFWRWLTYGSGVVILSLVGVFFWHKTKEKLRQRKLDHILSTVRQAGLEDYIKILFQDLALDRKRVKTLGCREIIKLTGTALMTSKIFFSKRN